jgi:tRNA A-37 threonylcarbamoyl transferase component Bud32
MPMQPDTAKMPGLPDIAVCLKLTISILEQVEKRMTAEGPSMQLKFNHGQCNYLADKLRKAVDGADVFVMLLNKVRETPFTTKDIVEFLDIFKLLHAFAEQAGTFIQECCKDSWLLSARKLTNVMEHVLTMAFSLELCANVFSDRRKRVASLSSLLKPELVDKLIDDEAATIREKALSDKNAMLLQVEAVLDPSSTSGIKEYQLAQILFKQLKRSSPGSVGSCFEEFEEKDCSSVKQLVMLGRGGYGTVYRGVYGELDIAKKIVSKGTDFLTFKKEVTILSQMSHSNVLSMHCYTVEKREQSIIMPYMEKNLSTLMDERVKAGREFPFTILVAVDIMSQIAWGMHYVHGMEIAHRDLKAENILVTLVARTEFVLVKVADFGASKMIKIDEEEGDENEEMRMIDVTPNIGTLRWKAPEQIQPVGTPKEKMPRKEAFIKVAQCDIYSFAMVCYEILTGDLPYGEISSPYEIKRRILTGERPNLPECHLRLIYLIQRCWSKEASERPPFGAICKELEYVKYELLMTCKYILACHLHLRIHSFKRIHKFLGRL